VNAINFRKTERCERGVVAWRREAPVNVISIYHEISIKDNPIILNISPRMADMYVICHVLKRITHTAPHTFHYCARVTLSPFTRVAPIIGRERAKFTPVNCYEAQMNIERKAIKGIKHVFIASSSSRLPPKESIYFVALSSMPPHSTRSLFR
jgi:hypothetical protein